MENLIVLEEKAGSIVHGNKKRFLSLCKCICGAEVLIRKDVVHKTKSCGCVSGPQATNLIGKTFNFLTVVDRALNKGQNVMWKCLCVCDNVVIVQGKALNSGHTKSCGCRGKERAFGFISQMYANYRVAAKRRNLNFELTFGDFSNLIKQNCHYCDSSPISKENRADVKRGSFKEIISVNGVDRVDNNLGYVVTNCVPCCSICNRAKRTLSYQDFISWINKIRKMSDAI